MKLELKEVAGASVVSVQAETLDIGNSVMMRDSLGAIMSQLKDIVVFDMAQIKSLDSSGIGVIIRLWQYLMESGKKLHMANCNTRVKDAFAMARLEEKIKLFDSVAEAIK